MTRTTQTWKAVYFSEGSVLSWNRGKRTELKGGLQLACTLVLLHISRERTWTWCIIIPDSFHRVLFEHVLHMQPKKGRLNSESWPRAGNPGRDSCKTDRTETSILAPWLVCYSINHIGNSINHTGKWIKIDAFTHQLPVGYLPKKGTSIN